ncbi:hypothetical protein AAG906_038811 [Vitis piasezkii]
MQGKNNGEEENRVKKTEDSSCSLPSHFWSTSRSPFSTCYIPFQSSGSQESNASNRPSEDNCSRGVRNFRTTPSKFAQPMRGANFPLFSKYGCYVMAWMQSHGNFSHLEVISYELLEGEVFNSKFCINPLEPISMENLKDHHMCSSPSITSVQSFEKTKFSKSIKEKNLVLKTIKIQ